MNIATQLKQKRESAGLTQRELAEKSGVPINNIGRYERNAASPNVTTLEKLAGVLGTFLVGAKTCDTCAGVGHTAWGACKVCSGNGYR